MDISRRMLIAAGASGPVMAKAHPGKLAHFLDPRASATGIVKVQGDLNPARVSPWWYEISLYAIVESMPAILILGAEGCETYAMQRQPDGGYRSAGVTITAFKDPVTSVWIDDFQNPLTGKLNKVWPNVISGVSMIYPLDGSLPQIDTTKMTKAASGLASASQATVPKTPGWMKWLESTNRIGCTMQRGSTGSAQPYMEISSIWTDRASFFDEKLSRVEATFTSAFLSPWLGWMEMAGHPGHILWHSTGRKLASLAELPAGYRARAEQLAPGRLAAKPIF